MACYRTVGRYSVQVNSAAYLSDGLNVDEVGKHVGSSKFLLFKEGSQGPKFTNVYNQTARRAIAQGDWPYRLAWSLPLPDGSVARIYQRTDSD